MLESIISLDIYLFKNIINISIGVFVTLFILLSLMMQENLKKYVIKRIFLISLYFSVTWYVSVLIAPFLLVVIPMIMLFYEIKNAFIRRSTLSAY